AHMPAAADLPEELAELSFRSAIEIRDERFDADVEQLDTFLAGELHVPGNPDLRSRTRATRLAAAITLLVIACGIAGYALLRPAGRGAFGAVTPAAVTPAASVPAAPVQAAVDIDGEWVAEMRKPGREPFRIRLSFQRVGDSIGGMVQYSTRDGPLPALHPKGP